jgi:hypothetical protein
MYQYFSKLGNQFVYSKTASERIKVANLETEYPITGNGNIRFYIDPLTPITPPILELTIIFKLLAVLFLLIYIHFISEIVVKRYGFWKGLLFLAAVLI